jgi:hypothetical protein
MKAAFHFFQKFPIVFRFSSVIKQVLLIFSYFTTCPGGGSAGYVVVVAQGMWWRWRRICGGEINKKNRAELELGQNWIFEEKIVGMGGSKICFSGVKKKLKFIWGEGGPQNLNKNSPEVL